jgi:flagellar biosynthesis/type III secretory pathway protein FliH
MNDFCVARINSDALLRTRHGILRASAMTLTLDARAAAARILELAEDEAGQIRRRAEEQGRAAVTDAEARVLRRAACLLEDLEQRRRQMLLGAEDMVVDLALALFDHALARTTPRERVAVNCQRLRQETPRGLSHPVLWLHPDDTALAPELEWEIKSDPALRPGACRLEAGDGEWRLDFEQGVAALKAAFTAAARPDATEVRQDQETIPSTFAPDPALF